LTASKSSGAVITSKLSPSSRTSSAPASRAIFHQLVLTGRVRLVYIEIALVVEHPGHAAILAHVAAVFIEDMADFGHGAVFVVRQRLHQDGGAAGAVAFIGVLFVADALPVHRCLSLMARSMLSLGMFSALAAATARAQSRVGVQIAPTRPGSHGNFLDQFGKDLSPLGILGAFAVLDGRPLIVS
jgi:hypothetical protein